MPDDVFSAARLRGYRVIEAAELEDAVALLVLNTVVAAHLWLPLSLTEIAFRNAVDRAVSQAHPAGPDWLFERRPAGNVLVARDVVGRSCFHGARDDGTTEDLVAMAAMMARRQLGRGEIARDDLIAHLMLGFWVVRVPAGLRADGLDVFRLVASSFSSPLDDPDELKRVIVHHVLRTRNRVAHHEPLLFRAKHVFSRRGVPKQGADLVSSLLGAIDRFLEEVDLVVGTARTVAPMAGGYLAGVPDAVRSDVAVLQSRLRARSKELQEQRDARRLARRRTGE